MDVITKKLLKVVKIDIQEPVRCSHCRSEVKDEAYRCESLEKILCVRCSEIYKGMVECLNKEQTCRFQGCMARFQCVLDNVLEYSPVGVLEDIVSNKNVNLTCDRISELLTKGELLMNRGKKNAG